LLIARRSLEIREQPPRFISTGLSEPGEEWKTVDLKNFCSFWNNPTRFLLTKRLGMDLGEKTSRVEDTESFEIKELEKYLLEQTLVEREIRRGDLKGFFPLAKASGLLPHGTVGECVYRTLSQNVEQFVQKTRVCLDGKTPESLEVDLTVADFKLIGRIDGVFADRLLHYRYAKVKSKDYLRLWIHHLVAQCAEDIPCQRVSLLAALDPRKGEPCLWHYEPVKNNKALLIELLEHYWEGLAKPLHFFPESSWHYAHARLKQNKSEADAVRIARNTWSGFNRGEQEDPYYQCCFKGAEPLDEAFQSLAEKVFGPLLNHQKEVGA
jgi:exodeoxyribonuclease V gamma subunit